MPETLPNNSRPCDPVLATHAFHLGTGIPRASEAWARLELRDEREMNQFRAVVWQPESQPESEAESGAESSDQVTDQVADQVAEALRRLLKAMEGKMMRAAQARLAGAMEGVGAKLSLPAQARCFGNGGVTTE